MDYNQNGSQNQYPYGMPNPYGNQYDHASIPPVKRANSMAVASMSMGIISLVLAFTCTLYPTLICGGVAIIFALLSKGTDAKMHSNAKTGLITAIIGLLFDIAVIGISMMLIFSPLAVPEYKNEFNRMYEQIYGESFDDTMKEISGDM
ncbi:MAG: hypothetical protein PHE02_11150 [Lachnospiraceae bacterium]|nr:hypothetical protein [Lachnospiraceae bacterium]